MGGGGIGSGTARGAEEAVENAQSGEDVGQEGDGQHKSPEEEKGAEEKVLTMRGQL